MYQIFVVEDELLIRQSIRNMIEKLSGPYAFCGEASDGEMALSMMQDLMPDILLTDIKMPFLDGFELVRHVKAMMPWLKIVIISGFDDFEYAQKAISLGVDLYLLKPLRSSELAHAIEQLAHQIEAERKEEHLPSGYDRDELRSALHQHFMHQLLGGSVDTATLLEQARTLSLNIVRPFYQIVLFSFDGLDKARQSALQPAVVRLLDELRLSLYDFNEYDQLTLLLDGTDAEALNEDAYRIVNILRHELKDLCPVMTTVVGSVVNRMSSVADAYRTAKYKLRHLSDLASGKVVSVNDTAQITTDILNFSSPFGGEFQHRLMNVTKDEVPALVDECLEKEAFSALGSAMMRYYALIDILKLTGSILSQLRPEENPGDALAQITRQHDFFAAAETMESFRSLAVVLLQNAVSIRWEAEETQRANPVIRRAEAYVAEHFCEPSLSLLSVARHVGMSSAYFSTVFSQATGTPFIAYLTGLRMEKAKQLLVETDMKLSAIAMEIGYNEPNYFSHVFRKTVGMTPKEYRNLNNPSGR